MNKTLAIDLNNFMFNNEQITIIMDKDNNPWFYGNQIAAILGYERPRGAILKHVDEEDKEKQMDIKLLSHNNKDLTYNEKNTIFINEPGLYSLMLSSKKEEAKIFRRWIAKEIFPAIRKYGEYKLNKKIEKLTKDFNEQLRIKDEQILLLNKEINLNSKQNIFKLCKTALNNLKKKLSIYNTKTDSPYYCVYYKKVYSVE